MPVKKATATKAAVKKPAAKSAPAKRTTTKASTVKGEGYECYVCGLAVVVDEVCGCVDACDIICCGKPMKKRAKKAATTAKAKAPVKKAAKK